MKTINDYNALAKQVTTHPCDLIKLEWRGGDAAAATGLFVQVHDANDVPSTGAVPAKSWPLYQASEGYKEFKNGELNLAVGCFIGVSSTEATYTAATGNNKWAMLAAEFSEKEFLANNDSEGDLTTGVTGLAVWPESAGPKRLFALEIDGSSLGATRYAMLFAKDSPVNGDTPLAVWPVTVATPLIGARAITFGKGGRPVFSKDADQTSRKGCTIKMSSTATTLTLIVSGTACIKAEYK